MFNVKETMISDAYKPLHNNAGINLIIEKYKKEIYYLEEEINYWIIDNNIRPCEKKENKIKELEIELKNIKEKYEQILKSI